MWCGLCLSHSVEVLNVDELVVIEHTRVGQSVLLPTEHVRKVSESLVPPLVEGAEAGASSPLAVQLCHGHAQSHKPGEHRLLHVRILLEGHVLDHWRKLEAHTHTPTLHKPDGNVLTDLLAGGL